MFATTEQKARFLDLVTGMMEMVRDGKRAIEPILEALQNIKDNPNFVAQMMAKTLTVWRTIRVGGLTKNELLVKLIKAGRNISSWSKDIMSRTAFVTSPEAHEVGFIRSKVKELGFTKAPTTPELIARVKELGGQPCQPEDGPWLALQELECGDWFWLIMEPIVDSCVSPGVFYVDRIDSDGRWLSAGCASPGRRWNLGEQVIFRSGK